MPSNIRSWLPCVALAAAVAVLGVVRALRPRPVEPQPSPPGESRQWMQAPYLQYILRRGGLDVSVVACPGRDDAYYLFDGEPKSAMAGGLKAEEEYADDWRGVALCEVGDPRRPVWAAIKSAHDFTSGPFHFFGDAELLGRVRKALGIAQGAPPGA